MSCKTRIKILQNESTCGLENDVNKWIESSYEQILSIVDINIQASVSNGDFLATITYKSR